MPRQHPPSPLSGEAAAAFATPSLTTGTPFVSSFCTPNTTHRRSRPPPLVPKMPLGPGQICSLCVLEDRTSVKRACVLAAAAMGDVGSLLSRSTSIYTQLGLSEVVKSRQPLNRPLSAPRHMTPGLCTCILQSIKVLLQKRVYTRLFPAFSQNPRAGVFITRSR